MPTNIKTVLFLCTGNYYRSRFAEELFNHRVGRAHLPWIASSRALAIERGKDNVGPLSQYVLEGAAARGFTPRAASRPPRQCVLADLESADRIIALNEPEHRPLMLDRFPAWIDRTEYWVVQDTDQCAPSLALAAVETRIEAMLRELVALSR